MKDLEENEKTSQGRVMRSRVERVVAADLVVIIIV
jgi:hypothetical protein